jgi:DNA polymerase elongation subunit (family B)
MELVCSFGYQGHKNHRLGRIEVHESINAWARHDLLKTASIAREHGFDILHGLSDSLWLKRFVKTADAEELSRRVEREIGIPFEVQGRYKWIVLLPNKTSNAPRADPVGALTRFYGCYDGDVMPTRSSGHQKLDYIRGGRVKVRGIELRQHSTSNIIRHIQEVVLERLADADDLKGLRAQIPRALDDAGRVLREIRDGTIPLHDLVITNSIMREEEEFRVKTHAWAAVSQLKRAGVRIPPGESVRYVVTNDTDRTDQRVREARLIRGDEEYDRAFYERLAIRALASLLIPFGLDETRLADRYSSTRQRKLVDARESLEQSGRIEE